MSGSPSAGATSPWAPVKLIILALLLLFDAALAVLLLCVGTSGVLQGGRPEWSTFAICAALLIAVVACGAGVFVKARSGRLGAALGLAAVPVVPAVLAAAFVLYALSHMGPHH